MATTKRGNAREVSRIAAAVKRTPLPQGKEKENSKTWALHDHRGVWYPCTPRFLFSRLVVCTKCLSCQTCAWIARSCGLDSCHCFDEGGFHACRGQRKRSKVHQGETQCSNSPLSCWLAGVDGARVMNALEIKMAWIWCRGDCVLCLPDHTSRLPIGSNICRI